MHMMEVDMHSPSFRTLRPGKRTRSPDATQSPVDRPSKRLSMAVNADGFVPIAFPLAYPARPVTPVQGGTDDHWVMRTRSLSLVQVDQDTNTHAGAPDQAESNSNARSNAQVEIDTDETMNLDRDPSPPRQPQSHMYENLQHPSPQPAIHILHAPSAPSPMHPPSSSASAYMLSAPVQALPTPPPGSDASRRPKFSMGPRADCEKCKMGVRGHWVHFD